MDRKFIPRKVAREIQSILNARTPDNFKVIAYRDRVYVVSESGVFYSAHILPVIAYMASYNYIWFIDRDTESNNLLLPIY